MFNGDVVALHTHLQVKQRVLYLLSYGSLTLAAVLIWESFLCLDKIEIFLGELKHNLSCVETMQELRGIVLELSEEPVWQAAR